MHKLGNWSIKAVCYCLYDWQRGGATGTTTTTDGSSTYASQLRAQTETGAMFVVYRQPIALDRFTVHDVLPPDNSPAAVDVTTFAKPLHPARSAKDSQRGAGVTAEYGEERIGSSLQITCVRKLTEAFLV